MSPLVATAYDHAIIPQLMEDFDTPFKAVDLFSHNEELIKLIKNINNNSHASEVVELQAAQDGHLEVHCVAVCFRKDGRVLIGRRPSDKKVFPETWEFGCAKLASGATFTSGMQLHYRGDFGAELEFFSDDPIGQFFIKEKKVPGIIFVAHVTNPEDVDAHNLPDKHTEIRWIDPTDPGLTADECVPDFMETLQKAHAVWQQHKQTTCSAT